MICCWFLIFLCVAQFIKCSDKSEALIQMWRDYDAEYDGISGELEQIDAEIQVEKNSIEKLGKLKEEMEYLLRALTQIQPMFHNSLNYGELDQFITEAEFEYHNNVDEMLQKEFEMERMWQDQNFWISFEFLLDRAVLTPQPAVPSIDPEYLNRLISIREKMLGDLKAGTSRASRELQGINYQVKRIEPILRNITNYTSEVFESTLTLLEMELETKMHNTSRRTSKEIHDLIVEFPLNQETKRMLEAEIKILKWTNNMNTKIENDFKEIRGFGEESETSEATSEGFLPQYVISFSNQIIRQRNSLKEADPLLHETLRRKYENLRTRPQANHFLIRKYLRIAEDMTDAIINRRASARPRTIYAEAIEEVKI